MKPIKAWLRGLKIKKPGKRKTYRASLLAEYSVYRIKFLMK